MLGGFLFFFQSFGLNFICFASIMNLARCTINQAVKSTQDIVNSQCGLVGDGVFLQKEKTQSTQKNSHGSLKKTLPNIKNTIIFKKKTPDIFGSRGASLLQHHKCCNIEGAEIHQHQQHPAWNRCASSCWAPGNVDYSKNVWNQAASVLRYVVSCYYIRVRF